MRGQVKNTPYPQPEGVLGETMIKHGKELGENSHFGEALCEMGESLRQMAGIKYALEDNIKQNFLDPLSQIKDNDLIEHDTLRKEPPVFNLPIKIIFEDENLLVVNKPPSIPVHPCG